MIEYKQGVTIFMPVRIFDSVGNPAASIAFGAVTAAVQKADGTQATVVVTLTDWEEVSTGAFAAAGVYLIKIPAAVMDQPGLFTYAVATAGNKTYIGAAKIVANEEADTYARIGAPVLASISADVAGVKSDVSTVSGNVTSTYNRIGAPILASISADVAGVKSDVSTVSGNVTTLGTDQTTILTIVELLQKYETGRWKIHLTGPNAKRLVLYDTDNTTILLKFDLKDGAGLGTYINPFERYPVP